MDSVWGGRSVSPEMISQRVKLLRDALEKAERDRTIYYRWQLVLLGNEILSGFRDHPRFVALVEQIQRDLSRQREQLESPN